VKANGLGGSMVWAMDLVVFIPLDGAVWVEGRLTSLVGTWVGELVITPVSVTCANEIKPNR
jgi:hypothetical protein